MDVIYAAFKSRRDAVSYAEALNSRGVPVRVVGSPARVGSSCGLSVKFPRRAAALAQSVLSAGEYASFLGFYHG